MTVSGYISVCNKVITTVFCNKCFVSASLFILYLPQSQINLIQSFPIDITITFSQSTYSVNENNESVQLVLVLSNPSSTDIPVRVRDTNNTATGE